LAKILRGIGSAAIRFGVVGIAFPSAIDYFYQTISKYVTLPPSIERWTAFIIFGVLFAITAFLKSSHENGDYPWLAGKIGGGIVDLAFYTYLLLLLPAYAGSQAFQLTGMLWLIYAAIFLSYLLMMLNFVHARRNRVITPVKAR
jgi:hypothetical protein